VPSDVEPDAYDYNRPVRPPFVNPLFLSTD